MTVRKQFVIQNRRIVRENSEYKEKINNLEEQLQELASENHRLRVENLQLRQEGSDAALRQFELVKSQLDSRWNAIIRDMEEIIAGGFSALCDQAPAGTSITMRKKSLASTTSKPAVDLSVIEEATCETSPREPLSDDNTTRAESSGAVVKSVSFADDSTDMISVADNSTFEPGSDMIAGKDTYAVEESETIHVQETNLSEATPETEKQAPMDAGSNGEPAQLNGKACQEAAAVTTTDNTVTARKVPKRKSAPSSNSRTSENHNNNLQATTSTQADTTEMTPEPVQRNPLSEKTANDTLLDLPRRRSRGVVKSYAEPSLRTKMRREQDRLVSAIVDAEDKENAVPVPSKRSRNSGGALKKRRRDSSRPPASVNA